MNLLADGDAFEVALFGLFGNLGKVIVEDDFGSLDASRNDQVGVHHVIINIDHEIRVDPVVICFLASSDCGSRGIDLLTDERARLQAIMPSGFNGVVAVVEHVVETAVNMRYVVATVEIIIDENLPVAVQIIRTTLEPVQTFKVQGFNSFKEIGVKKLF